jgi:hypothetical protein
MSRVKLISLFGLALLLLLATACASYSQMGVKTTTHQDMDGGAVQVRIKKANGSTVQDIEIDVIPGVVLEAYVTLTVEKGTFRIELLGENDEATLALEARDGQTLSEQGQMYVDSFGEASYRITATEAENVEYAIEYSFQ